MSLVQISLPSDFECYMLEGRAVVVVEEKVARVLAYTLIQFALEHTGATASIGPNDHRELEISPFPKPTKPAKKKSRRKRA